MDSSGTSGERHEIPSLQACTNTDDLIVPTRENARVALNYQSAVPDQAALFLEERYRSSPNKTKGGDM